MQIGFKMCVFAGAIASVALAFGASLAQGQSTSPTSTIAVDGLPPPPIETLLKLPTIRSVSMSDDGNWIAGIQERPGGQVVLAIDWRTPRAKAVASTSYVTGQEIGNVSWKAGRIVFSVSQLVNRRGVAISREQATADPGKAFVTQSIYAVSPDGSVLLDLRRDRLNRVESSSYLDFISMLPGNERQILISATDEEMRLWKADVFTGELTSAGIGTASTSSWEVDGEGNAVMRVEELRRGAGWRYQRRAAGTSIWHTVIETRTTAATNSPDFQIVAPGPGRNQVYVLARPNEQNFASLYRFNTASAEYGDPVAFHPSADITGVFFNETTGRVMAFCTTVQRLECQSDDPEVMKDLTAIQNSVGADKEVSIDSSSADGKVWLVSVSSPTIGSVYYGFDRTTRRLNKIIAEQPDLANFSLAPTRIVNYAGRDGTALWAYVTGRRNPGDPPSPVVVLPHGGPEARDYYGYDDLVQMIAARGYLVVQPNFRGSEGFGRAFMRAGQGQWGKRMQDDVIDAFHAVVASGDADPKRACIVGWSYGGYAALMGAARDPDLFRCAASIAGVSDLVEILRDEQNRFSAQSSADYLYWRVSIGEIGKDEAGLIAVSPARMAAQIKAPILLIHGTSDNNVEPKQSEIMAKALRAANKPHDILLIENGDHGLSELSDRAQAFKRLDAFLQTHLGVAP